MNENLVRINNKYFLLIFFFTTFSGAIRKWFLTDIISKNFIFALQLLVPFIFIIANPYQLKKAFTNKVLGIYLLILVGLAINPLNETIYHGIIGILIHFSFWFIMFYYVANREYFDFTKSKRLILFTIVGQFALSVLQYQLPADNFLNAYADIEKVGGSIAVVGSSVRVTGTFSYISGYTSFLIFFNYFLWTMFKGNYKPYLILLVVAAGFYANLISGSRGATYGYILFILLIFYFERSFFRLRNIGTVIFPALILFSIFLIANTDKLQALFETAFSNFNQRSQQGLESGETQFRLFWDLVSITNFQGNYPFFGVGLGSTYQGATAVFGVSRYVTEYGYVEGELIRIVLEGGFVLLTSRVVLAFILMRHLNFPNLFKVILFFQIVYQYQIVFNVYNTIYFALGIIMLDSFYRPRKKVLIDLHRQHA